MSIEVKIVVQFDSATPRLKRLLTQLEPKRVATAVAPVAAEHWRDHLASLPRNRHGYPSTGFWEDAARSVTGVATDDGALISCSKIGVRQRLHGGPVVAVNVENLTISICAEAYGTTVDDWGRDNLTLVVLADGRKFLAAAGPLPPRGRGRSAAATARRAHRYADLTAGGAPKVIVFRGSGGGTGKDTSRAAQHLDLKFLFRLTPETAPQAPNPDVIPNDLAQVAKAAIVAEVLK